jgi:decaprenylphospho-beta-D-ribofuranose 2-oxidase
VASTSPTSGPRLLSGWGRTAPTRATVHRLTHAADAGAALARAGGRGVVARGLGRSYGDAAQNAGGLVLLTTGMRAIKAFDARTGIITVEAGLDIDELTRLTLPGGWFVPVTPGTRWITVGGAIACDIHGKNHHRDGSFCDHVVSLELQTPSGERTTLTPGDTPHEFWATAGGMGLTGVIVEATIQLIGAETGWMRVDTERARDLGDALDRMSRGDDGYRYSVAWIDLLAGGRTLGRSVLTRGDHATLGELPAGAQHVPQRRRSLHLAAPRRVPSGLLNRQTVRAFNELWYRRAPRSERGRLQSFESFFYPLDGVVGWNRLYGPRGFVQYQLALPFGEEDSLRRIVARLHDADVPSCLGVLKRFGANTTGGTEAETRGQTRAGRGSLSFPLPGWTLAVDLPASLAGLGPLLDGLDELVAEAGGRVYLAKDARLRRELIESMYPELPRWRAIRASLDPEHAMRSDLARRIGL